MATATALASLESMVPPVRAPGEVRRAAGSAGASELLERIEDELLVPALRADTAEAFLRSAGEPARFRRFLALLSLLPPSEVSRDEAYAEFLREVEQAFGRAARTAVRKAIRDFREAEAAAARLRAAGAPADEEEFLRFAEAAYHRAMGAWLLHCLAVVGNGRVDPVPEIKSQLPLWLREHARANRKVMESLLQEDQHDLEAARQAIEDQGDDPLLTWEEVFGEAGGR